MSSISLINNNDLDQDLSSNISISRNSINGRTSINGLYSNSETNLTQYIAKISKFPLLSAELEYKYGLDLYNNNCKNAAKILIQSHLRLVVKMASKFKNYGLPIADLISEGNIGLINAVKKFNPKKGFRLSTYAMWWIRAYIQDYILKSWSLVKIGTTIAQKKLFFNLNKIKKKILLSSNLQLDNDQISQISNLLNLSVKEISEMDSRLSQSDTSINNMISANSESKTEISDTLICSNPLPDEIAITNQENEKRRLLFIDAFKTLNIREQEIISKRQMQEKPQTLEELSKIYSISRERIRQIEEGAIKKIKKHIKKLIAI